MNRRYRLTVISPVLAGPCKSLTPIEYIVCRKEVQVLDRAFGAAVGGRRASMNRRYRLAVICPALADSGQLLKLIEYIVWRNEVQVLDNAYGAAMAGGGLA